MVMADKSKPTNVLRPQFTSPLHELADKTVHELLSRLGVDGVFIVLYRASDDTMGTAMCAPTLSIDSMVGLSVAGLAMCRAQVLAAAGVPQKPLA
jgi:hypothetical protein